jgi:hypothetical protein
VRRPSVSLLAALALAAPVAAQAPGLAIHAAGLPTGLHVAGTAGFTSGTFTLGAGAGYAGSRLGITGALARVDFDSPDETAVAWGLRGVLRLLGGTLDLPLQVDAFAGYGRLHLDSETVPEVGGVGGGDNWHVPAGLAFTFAISTPVGSLRPWLAPRLDIFRQTTGDVTTVDGHLAASAGVDLRLLGGFGLTVAWDKIEGLERTIGVGLTYRF